MVTMTLIQKTDFNLSCLHVCIHVYMIIQMTISERVSRKKPVKQTALKSLFVGFEYNLFTYFV